ncbi:MAG: 2-oxo acid dehydrogenase subunit E2 [Candidatus Dormibacteraeota bacterium]|nr:2-oxo acid dehydrogenase subunit E2 [Candidatus Dormibacteraeota bacterium]MBV9524636.1 2-oxo acid dehydrogenase subunit E2 [Candidatus Dormibacteraeota bacterium]
MALTVNMPQLGESVTEGTIAKWLKQPGEAVAKYESIAEVITDKVNAEIPAPADGTMGELVAAEGAVVAVGQPICTIDTGEGSAGGPSPDVAETTPSAPSPQATTEAQEAPPAQQATQPSQPAPAAQPESQPLAPAAQQTAAQPEAPSGNGQGMYHLTPAVRMLVREHGVDLSQLHGSGIGGRITKKDVLEYVQRRDAGAPAAPSPQQPAAPAQPTAQPAPAAQAAPAQAAAPAPPPSAEDTVVPLTSVRRAIAEHMSRSKQTSPHAYLMVEVDMSAVSRARARARDEFEQRYGVKLTFLPFVARAVCEALRRHPTLNASWSDQGVVLKHDIHLGIAVALEDNLIVPVVRHADRLNIVGLATTMADLGKRARSNQLKLDEIQGGSFTLNNTGALGAVMTQAIINQPQAAIMTMDLVVKRPIVVEDDAIAIRPMMNLGMSFDHRINDGLQATRFVREVKAQLEEFDDSGPLL